jgi:hypothetical protein
MPKKLLLILLFPTLLFARTIGFGGVASDTTGVGCTEWYSSFVGCFGNEEAADTLRQVGSSYDALTDSEFNLGAVGDIVVIGTPADTIVVESEDPAGLSFRCNNLKLHDVYYRGSCYLKNSGADSFVWDGGCFSTITNPPHDPIYDTALRIYGTSALFQNMSFNGAAEEDFSYDIVASGLDSTHQVAFENCTVDLVNIFDVKDHNGGSVRFSDCDIRLRGYLRIQASTYGPLDSLIVEDCTWRADHVDRCIRIEETSELQLLRIQGNTISGLAADSFCEVVVEESIDFTSKDNLFKFRYGSNSALAIYDIYDKTKESRYTFDGDVVWRTEGVGYLRDYLNMWAVPDSGVMQNLELHAGAITILTDADAPDTLEATIATGWDFNNIEIDHTGWEPIGSTMRSVALGFVGSHSTFDNIAITSPASHSMLFGDDVVDENQWAPAWQGICASDNVVKNSSFTQLNLHDGEAAFGLVDKGDNQEIYNNTFRVNGSDGSVSKAYSFGGDNTLFYNNRIFVGPSSATKTGVVGLIAQGPSGHKHQPSGQLVHNNYATGVSDYVFAKSSGDGTGYTESHNIFDTGWTDFNSQTADEPAPSSFIEGAWKTKYGGTAVAGASVTIPHTDQGFYPIGLLPETAHTEPRVSSRWLSGFNTPRELCGVLDTLGMVGVQLEMYVRTDADCAQVDLWCNDQIVDGDDVTADTLWIKRCIK